MINMVEGDKKPGDGFKIPHRPDVTEREALTRNFEAIEVANMLKAVEIITDTKRNWESVSPNTRIRVENIANGGRLCKETK